MATKIGCTDNVDIAKLVQPEVVNSIGGSHVIATLELPVNLVGSDVEFMEDPFFDQALLACRLSNNRSTVCQTGLLSTHLRSSLWHERLVKLQHRKFRRVEYFVAELAVTFYAENLQVDVATCV